MQPLQSAEGRAVATGAVVSQLMSTRTGVCLPQRPHRPQLKPNRNNQIPHAAEPTRKPLFTRESNHEDATAPKPRFNVLADNRPRDTLETGE